MAATTPPAETADAAQPDDGINLTEQKLTDEARTAMHPTADGQPSELTWDDVWAAIGREVWKLAPQDFQDSAHRDLVFGTCWQNIMEAVHNGIVAVAALPDEDDQ